jgi:hypothetical protein
MGKAGAAVHDYRPALWRASRSPTTPPHAELTTGPADPQIARAKRQHRQAMRGS